MKQLTLQSGDRSYTTLGTAIDLSIPLRFDGPQPGFFGADTANARPMHVGDFIGDTRLGGSCNAEHVDLIPHCNGTHTECVGHITNERVPVNNRATDALYLAAVVTIDATAGDNPREKTGLSSHKSDTLITARALQQSVLAQIENDIDAVIVRTLPNDKSKTHRDWNADETPYFSVEAMNWIVRQGVRHLLVDTPSVDRLDDDRLIAHRIFWGMDNGSRSVSHASRADATISELLYIPDDVEDGLYLLNLQIAPFVSDAAPSRPLLYRIAE